MLKRNATFSLVSLVARVLIGACLAFVGILLAQLIFGEGPAESLSSTTTGRPLAKEELDPHPADADPRARLSSDISSPIGRSVSVLREVLDRGDSQSLQLLRSDLLRGFDEYEEILLPALKEQALDNLLARMTETDYVDWPHAYMSNAGKPSNARLYTDDLWAVNSDLGSFLETSAALLFRLHANTRLGQPFDLRGAIPELFAGAVPLPPGRSLESSYVRTISLDPIFRSRFERVRGRLVAEYVGANQKELTTVLDLLFTLKPRYCGPDALQAISDSLTLLSTEGSMALRSELFQEEEKAQVLHGAARVSPDVRRAVAELYAVGAVDAIEARDLLTTRRYLAESRSLEPGLRSQRIVLDFLRDLGLSEGDLFVLDQQKTGSAAEHGGPVRFLGKAPARPASSGSLPWFWIVCVLLLAAFGAMSGRQILTTVRDAIEERKLRDYSSAAPAPISITQSSFTDWKLDDLAGEPVVEQERKTAQNEQK